MQDCSFPWSKLTAVDWQLIASSRDPGKFSLVTKRKKIQYVFHLTRYMVVTAWFFYFLLLFFYTLPVSTENVTQALFQENTLEACKKKKKQNQNTKHHHHGQKKKNQQQTIQTKNLTTSPECFPTGIWGAVRLLCRAPAGTHYWATCCKGTEEHFCYAGGRVPSQSPGVLCSSIYHDV